jgi:transcriptional regulator with XRE-family HTH domain
VAGRDAKRLAQAVKAAREELGLTQREFAERGGIAMLTVQRIEQEKVQPRTKTFTGLDKAAGWPSGTARAILEHDAKRPPSRVVDEEDSRPYYDPVAGTVDQEAILRRMIELVPSIRRSYGDRQADLMVGRIMELAIQANLADLVGTELSRGITQGDKAS